MFSVPRATRTQDCVQAVAQAAYAPSFWDQWCPITLGMLTSLKTACFNLFEETVRMNHRFLDQIGVVPHKSTVFH